MLVKIKRQRSAKTESYWQTFEYNGDKNVTVSAVLDALNYTDDLVDVKGNKAPRIRWECSCMQMVCGGCAMVINGTPALACGTFLHSLKGDMLILEPLNKFPVIADLIVDRSIIYENLNRARTFLEGEALQKENSHNYSLAKCLKCGLCLEVCPNYKVGTDFFGPVFANEMALLYSQSESGKKEQRKTYSKHFAMGCSKALSCRSICPAGIETLTSILKMNRI